MMMMLMMMRSDLKWINIVVSCSSHSFGDVVGYVCTIRNVCDRVTARAELFI